MAGADAVGLGSVNGMRLVGCVVGSVGIVVVGLLGREIAGDRVGMIAAGIAALYPVWWLSDSLLQAEALYMPLVAGTLLLGYRLWKRPSSGRRPRRLRRHARGTDPQRRVLLLVLVAACVLLLRHGLAGIRRFQCLAVALLVAAATVAPWLVYNATRFDRPVLMSTNDGATLADTNCPAAYSGPGLGLYVFQCHVPAVDESGDESDRARRLDRGGPALRARPRRPPPRRRRRPGRDRVWGVFRPIETIRATSCTPGRTAARNSWRGRTRSWRSGPRRVLRAPPSASADLAAGRSIVAVTITAATTYGIIRFRVPGDVAFVVLFAVTIERAGQPHLPHDQPCGPAEEWVAA